MSASSKMSSSKPQSSSDWCGFDGFDFEVPYIINTEDSWDSEDVEITQVTFPKLNVGASYKNLAKNKKIVNKRTRCSVDKTDINRKTATHNSDIHNDTPHYNTEWCEMYIPSSISDLAITAGRDKEITKFIEGSLSSPKPALICLTGPPGAGKSTTIKVIAKSLGVNVVEWVNPVSISIQQEDYFSFNYEGGRIEFPPTQTNLFKTFLYQGNYSLLNSSKNAISSPQTEQSLSASCTKNYSYSKKILLVDDIPYVFLMYPSRLHDILGLYLRKCRHILVFIVTTSDMPGDAMRQLFPDKIIKSLSIFGLQFRPPSVTAIKKVLKRIMELKIRTSDAVLIDDICEAAGGDIRCAINMLQFHLAPDCATLNQYELSNKYNKPKPRKITKKSLNSSTQSTFPRSSSFPLYSKLQTNQESSQLNKNSFSYRNQFLSTFHIIGKCFSAKRLEWSVQAPPLRNHHSSHYRLQLYYDPGLVFDNSCLTTSTLLGFLHGNYLTHFMNLNEAYEASVYLSIANTLSSLSTPLFGTPNHYSPYIAMLGISHSITEHVPNQSMFGQKSQERKMNSAQNDNKHLMQEMYTQLPCSYTVGSCEKFASDTLPYLMLTLAHSENPKLSSQLIQYYNMNTSPIFSKNSVLRNTLKYSQSNNKSTIYKSQIQNTQLTPQIPNECVDDVAYQIDRFEDEDNW